MWISKKKIQELEKKIADLEEKVEGQRNVFNLDVEEFSTNLTRQINDANESAFIIAAKSIKEELNKNILVSQGFF